jgi:WS/DGAT/MGAT family acyltransferase
MRMSDAEAIMWAVEKDPALRSDFCNLTILDRRPDDARLRATLDRALVAIPRLRQRVVAAPWRMVPPEFAEDPTLDVDAHIRVVAVPSPGGERELLDLCGSLAEQPLDRARPLWEFTLIVGLADGGAALLQKIHHTISDGVGALKLSLALVDFERDPEGQEPAAIIEPEIGATNPLGVTRDAFVEVGRRSVDAVKKTATTASHIVTHPGEVPNRALDLARLMGSLHRQALITSSSRSDVMTNRSLRRYFATQHLSFPALRAAASKLGGSVNDAFITGLASGLGRYHERLGSDVDELRLAMPISTRERGDQASNRFVPARVIVPIQPAHDLRTLFGDIRERLVAAKGESALSVADGFAGVVSGLPTSVLVGFTRSQTRTIDFAASNLRGSPVPLYLSGSRIIANYPFGPRTGSPLNVTMLTYGDDAHLGYNIDPIAVVEAEKFLDDVQLSFESLFALA